ncbi:hypothetical protein [Brackiella oedipodis]|nr:hypothetical protein [Brackiella oedipodis]
MTFKFITLYVTDFFSDDFALNGVAVGQVLDKEVRDLQFKFE